MTFISHIKHHKLWLQGICIFLLGLIIWLVVCTVQSIISLNDVASAPSLASASQSSTVISDVRISASIFGEYVPKNIQAAGVKASDLNVVIVGIMYAEDASDSQVLIRLSDGYDHIFHVGDALPDGGIIKRIAEDGVLVLRKGVMERLSLPRDELTFELPAKALDEETDDAY